MSLLQPLMMNNVVNRICSPLATNRNLQTLAIEVLGINVPKTAMVRTKKEALDVGFNEFGNTLGFFGGLWGIGALFDKLVKIPGEIGPASPLRLMKSFALVPPLFAFMMSTPYFRNAFTAWKSGTTQYKDLITNDQQTSSPQNGSLEASREAAKGYLMKALGILGAGIGIGALGILLTRWGPGPLAVLKDDAALSKLLGKTWEWQKPIRSLLDRLPDRISQAKIFNQPFQPLKTLWNTFCLAGTKANVYGDTQAILFWGLPAYLGWMAASRDKYEIKEQLLKMLNFMVIFKLIRMATDKALESKINPLRAALPSFYKDGRLLYKEALGELKNPTVFNNPTVKKALMFENIKILGGLGLTVIFMATLPALLNIYLTKKRMQRDQRLSHGPNPLEQVISTNQGLKPDLRQYSAWPTYQYPRQNFNANNPYWAYSYPSYSFYPTYWMRPPTFDAFGRPMEFLPNSGYSGY